MRLAAATAALLAIGLVGCSDEPGADAQAADTQTIVSQAEMPVSVQPSTPTASDLLADREANRETYIRTNETFSELRDAYRAKLAEVEAARANDNDTEAETLSGELEAMYGPYKQAHTDYLEAREAYLSSVEAFESAPR